MITFLCFLFVMQFLGQASHDRLLMARDAVFFAGRAEFCTGHRSWCLLRGFKTFSSFFLVGKGNFAFGWLRPTKDYTIVLATTTIPIVHNNKKDDCCSFKVQYLQLHHHWHHHSEALLIHIIRVWSVRSSVLGHVSTITFIRSFKVWDFLLISVCVSTSNGHHTHNSTIRASFVYNFSRRLRGWWRKPGSCHHPLHPQMSSSSIVKLYFVQNRDLSQDFKLFDSRIVKSCHLIDTPLFWYRDIDYACQIRSNPISRRTFHL